MLLRWENSSWISLKTVSAARRTCYLKPIRILVTEGTRADCKEAVHLIEGISAETLLADRGYDKYLYKQRHLVENCFLILKRWRGIATRYAKTHIPREHLSRGISPKGKIPLKLE